MSENIYENIGRVAFQKDWEVDVNASTETCTAYIPTWHVLPPADFKKLVALPKVKKQLRDEAANEQKRKIGHYLARLSAYNLTVSVEGGPDGEEEIEHEVLAVDVMDLKERKVVLHWPLYRKTEEQMAKDRKVRELKAQLEREQERNRQRVEALDKWETLFSNVPAEVKARIKQMSEDDDNDEVEDEMAV